ncbi:MAG TPA: hypothetical protein VIP98_14795 [Microlunatus sp.]
MSNDDSQPSGRSKNRGAAQGLPNLPTLPNLGALSEAFGTALGGASRLTRARAQELAERILSQAGLENVDLGEAASGATTKINQLAEELMAARKANRELLQRTVSTELDKSLGRLGLARAEDIDQLRDEVARLRSDVTELKVSSKSATPAAARKTTAKKTATKQTTAKRAAAKKTAAKKTPAKKTPAKKTTAKKATAKKSTGAA